MNEIETIRKYLKYNPDTGLIYWIKSPGRKIKVGQVAGSKMTRYKLEYRRIRFKGKYYLAHRLAWLLHYGEWPKKQIDHIDGNGLNNKINNIRDVSPRINQENRRDNNEYIGVVFHSRDYKWVAFSSSENTGKQKFLGNFKTHLAACYARHAYEVLSDV